MPQARRHLRCRPYTGADLDSAVPSLALIPLLQSCPSNGETLWAFGDERTIYHTHEVHGYLLEEEDHRVGVRWDETGNLDWRS